MSDLTEFYEKLSLIDSQKNEWRKPNTDEYQRLTPTEQTWYRIINFFHKQSMLDWEDFLFLSVVAMARLRKLSVNNVYSVVQSTHLREVKKQKTANERWLWANIRPLRENEIVGRWDGFNAVEIRDLISVVSGRKRRFGEYLEMVYHGYNNKEMRDTFAMSQPTFWRFKQDVKQYVEPLVN